MWRALFKPPPSTSTSTSISSSNIPSSSNNPNPHHPHHGASSSSTSGSASISASNIHSSSNNPHPHHPHHGASSSSTSGSASGSVSSSSNNKKNPYTSKMASFLKRLGRCTSFPIRCLDRKGFLFPRSSSDPTPSDLIPDDVQERRFSVVLASKELHKLAVSDKGSKVVMNSINESTAALILEKISDHIFEVMRNKNGTKVVGCLCKFQSSLTPLALTVLKEPDDLRDVVFHWNGIGLDSVRELLGSLNKAKSPHTCEVVESLATLSIMRNCRTQPLIMYCLNNLNSADNTAIYQCALDWLVNLSRMKLGQEILSRLIQLEDNPLRDQLLTAICNKTSDFSLDSHGSHVIQDVLELQKPHLDELICTQVRDNILPLSKDIYGKFVVRRCLESSSCRRIIVDELLIGQRLYHLARVHSGVSVVMTAINETQKKDIVLLKQIEGSLKQHMKALEKHPVGVSVYNLLTRARQ